MEMLFCLEKNGSLCKANMKREGKRSYCPLFTQSEKLQLFVGLKVQENYY